jgi:hypothetical protein
MWSVTRINRHSSESFEPEEEAEDTSPSWSSSKPMTEGR